jgi:transcription antitermination factor NusG
MKKIWLVASYKTNKIESLASNLSNQKFDFYLPKITTKKINNNSKEELLFPGYIFVNIGLENYSALKYTIGIKNIIKFGENITFIDNKEIKSMQIAEKKSKIYPVGSQIQIGQEATISYGSLKGSMVKICSLSSQDRVNVLLTFLGSMRRISISKKDLIF